MTTFTREDLKCICCVDYHLWQASQRERDLATFALALLDQKDKAEAERDEARVLKVPATTEAVMLAEMVEKVARTEAWAAKEELLAAEAERARLREELREAEEAINAASGMSFLREMGWTEHPAVRRAIDRASDSHRSR